MNNKFMILLMIFLHVFDDYHLQGILANLKQKSYWQRVAPDKMYRHDYIMALAMHSMSWSFMIMLPIAYCMNFNISVSFIITFVVNSIVHGVIDDLKANRHMIDLITDQTVHIVQIFVTAILYMGGVL